MIDSFDNLSRNSVMTKPVYSSSAIDRLDEDPPASGGEKGAMPVSNASLNLSKSVVPR